MIILNMLFQALSRHCTSCSGSPAERKETKGSWLQVWLCAEAFLCWGHQIGNKWQWCWRNWQRQLWEWRLTLSNLTSKQTFFQQEVSTLETRLRLSVYKYTITVVFHWTKVIIFIKTYVRSCMEFGFWEDGLFQLELRRTSRPSFIWHCVSSGPSTDDYIYIW